MYRLIILYYICMFGLVVSMNCVSKTNILNTVILNAYRTGSRTVLETLKVMHRYFLCSRQEEKTNNSFKRSFFSENSCSPRDSSPVLVIIIPLTKVFYPSWYTLGNVINIVILKWKTVFVCWINQAVKNPYHVFILRSCPQ